MNKMRYMFSSFCVIENWFSGQESAMSILIDECDIYVQILSHLKFLFGTKMQIFTMLKLWDIFYLQFCTVVVFVTIEL
jgi:hypothetical protein